MTRLDLRPADARTEAASRFELLAAAVEAEAVRAGDPIGYQWVVLEILRCLDDVDRGGLLAEDAVGLIAEHIAQAVVVDPFDRRSRAG